MKNLFNFFIVLTLLSGCVFPGPSCGYDVNCNKDISNSTWYKERTFCINEQQRIAKTILVQKYNEGVDSQIYSECIKNYKYIFKNDPKYK